MKQKSKVYIRVFITKTNKFRAKIDDRINHPYEVTIGGNNWKNGKGRAHSNIIFNKIENLLVSLNFQFNRVKYEH